ncbi:MAG: phosphate ABC transporter permease subunit PstC, partial [Clostridia bacterium]
MKKKFLQQGSRTLFLACACLSVGAVALICWFIFYNAIPALSEIGVFKFLFTSGWKPTSRPQEFGILYMLLGSIYVTAGAIVIGVPIGVLSAVYLAKFCPKRLYPIFSQAVSLLAGIPSIVYGFFGMMVLVPMIRQNLGGNGNSILAASLVLAIMILPTIISISENA